MKTPNLTAHIPIISTRLQVLTQKVVPAILSSPERTTRHRVNGSILVSMLISRRCGAQ